VNFSKKEKKEREPYRTQERWWLGSLTLKSKTYNNTQSNIVWNNQTCVILMKNNIYYHTYIRKSRSIPPTVFRNLNWSNSIAQSPPRIYKKAQSDTAHCSTTQKKRKRELCFSSSCLNTKLENHVARYVYINPYMF